MSMHCSLWEVLEDNYCVFVGDPATCEPLAIFATKLRAEQYQFLIGSKHPILKVKVWWDKFEYPDGVVCDLCGAEIHTCEHPKERYCKQ